MPCAYVLPENALWMVNLISHRGRPCDGRFSARPRVQEIFRKMERTQYSRKLDGQGRIMIPIRLREQVGLEPGQELFFFTHEHDGQKYLCIECPRDMVKELAEARKFLEEHGFIVSKSDPPVTPD